MGFAIIVNSLNGEQYIVELMVAVFTIAFSKPPIPKFKSEMIFFFFFL